MTRRARFRDISNNRANANKNLCVLAVARELGVGDATRYLHTQDDIVYAARQAWTVRSRKSSLKATVGASRAVMPKLTADLEREGHTVKGFLIVVDGHALLLDSQGQTVVDTDSRKRDKRRIRGAYIVYR